MPQILSKKVIASGLVVLVAVVLALSSFFIVNEGERGVLTRNGAFVGVQEPGLGFKVPLIDKVTEIEIRNMRMEVPVNVYSLDAQQYDAAVSINYDLNPAEVERIFKSEGIYYADRRLKPMVEKLLKEVAGKYSSQRTIQERDIFGAAVRDSVRNAAQAYGINVTEVQVTNIDFTDRYEEAIDDAMVAKADVEKERQVLEQKRIQAETRVVEAKAQANALREEAKGQADAKITQAQAEAARITQIGDAEAAAMQKKANSLRDNPELTAYTYALAAENWDGKLPTSFVPNSTLPMLNLKTGSPGQ